MYFRKYTFWAYDFNGCGNGSRRGKQGPLPAETVLSAAATSAIDIVEILPKMCLDVEGFSIAIRGQRAEEYPRRFTEIHKYDVLKGSLREEGSPGCVVVTG
ncbi:OsmC family protein [Thermoactinomyces mirandus]|uniref:OsmC family protein n=1 Tax=Thermoactinomyces mirandus TaxID=2756294 RepID=UPI001C68DC50|nr:hypothetical protein [Thermoactinomyces mirandus]